LEEGQKKPKGESPFGREKIPVRDQTAQKKKKKKKREREETSVKYEVRSCMV